ncbi:hypothetical protein DL93DRAFT_2089650 [Clavulina sp. PMI_390]|nr:hypothetical protein DL93DRAFT_2089650 [Clavulina sp. PMI_390]
MTHASQHPSNTYPRTNQLTHPSNNPPNHLMKFEQEIVGWSNAHLVHEEVGLRRSIASYITGLCWSGTSMFLTGGLTAPIAAFKGYKIFSKRDKLKAVRAELNRRHLTPNQKRVRDIVIPVAVVSLVYLTTLGLAEFFDFVPLDMQASFQEPIQEALSAHGVDATTENMTVAADKYEAFILAELASPITHPIIDHAGR